jgi:hypothetical protein
MRGNVKGIDFIMRLRPITYKKGALFIKEFVLINKQVFLGSEGGYGAGEVENFRKINLHGRGDWGGSGGHGVLVPGGGQLRSNAIDIGRVVKLPVITVLVLHIQYDVQTAKGAKRQSDQVDQAECPVLAEEPKRGFKIALEHGG